MIFLKTGMYLTTVFFSIFDLTHDQDQVLQVSSERRTINPYIHLTISFKKKNNSFLSIHYKKTIHTIGRMRLQLLGCIALLIPFVTASFSHDHDLYSKPEFVVLNDTQHYILDDQVNTYISSVKSTNNSEIEFMKYNNETYLCTYPTLSNQDLTTEDLQELKTWKKSELLEAKEYAAQALYKGMMSECIYYFKDWWTYSFCYGRDIKQFHIDPSQLKLGVPPDYRKADMLFVLGKFDRKPSGTMNYKVNIKHEDEVNYLSYNLNKGTVCDLTGKDRSIEVQFYCNPTQELDSVLWIKEVKSCEYKMAISTKKICGNPIFAHPEKVNPHNIDCRRIINAVELEKLQAEKEKAKKMAAIKSENQKKSGKNQQPQKKQQEEVANLLYNDLDFLGGAWKQLRLDPADSIGKNIQSYHDDPNHTLSLLMEKLRAMIRAGAIKDANGKPITVKDEFSTIIKLVDLNDQDVLFIKIALLKGELLIGIVSDDDSEEIYELDLNDDEDNDDELDESNDFDEKEKKRFFFVTTMAHATPTDVNTEESEYDDYDFEPFTGDKKFEDGEQDDKTDDTMIESFSKDQEIGGVHQEDLKQKDTLNDYNNDFQKQHVTVEQAREDSQKEDQVPFVVNNEQEREAKNNEEKQYYYYDGDEYLEDKQDHTSNYKDMNKPDEVIRDEL